MKNIEETTFFECDVCWKTVAWVALQSQNRGLIRWLIMQCIKQSSTLRVTSKKDKPYPMVVYKFAEQNHAIESFLKERERIKRIYNSILSTQCM